jgi:hypothetical protein
MHAKTLRILLAIPFVISIPVMIVAVWDMGFAYEMVIRARLSPITQVMFSTSESKNETTHGLSVMLEHEACYLRSFDIIQNGTVLSEGEVLKDNGQFVDISGGCCKSMQSRKPDLSKLRYEQSPLGVLLHSHDATYFHSMFEFGARLQYVMEHCPNQDVTWLIRGSPTQMMILDLLNKPPIIRVANLDQPRSSGMILIPPAPTRIQDVLSFRSSCMRAALRVLGLGTFPHLKSNLYLERLGKRVIRNRAELVQSFQEVFPGDLVTFPDTGQPLVDTVAAFANASRVFGGHGAGFTNVLFCRAGTHVFEVYKASQQGRVYGALSQLVGAHYHVFVDRWVRPAVGRCAPRRPRLPIDSDASVALTSAAARRRGQLGQVEGAQRRLHGRHRGLPRLPPRHEGLARQGPAGACTVRGLGAPALRSGCSELVRERSLEVGAEAQGSAWAGPYPGPQAVGSDRGGSRLGRTDPGRKLPPRGGWRCWARAARMHSRPPGL